jgi:hypothetical protein
MVSVFAFLAPHAAPVENRARRTLGIAVEWGRYGELYEYDFHLKRLKLPETDSR